MNFLKIILFAILINGSCFNSYSLNNKKVEVSSQGTDQFQDVSIIVSSCDKYKDLWHPFFELLYKYWPSLKSYNNKIPVLLMSNFEDFSYPGVKLIKVGRTGSWSNDMTKALSYIKTKYVLITLEDYLIKDFVNENFINNLIKEMKHNHIPYIQLSETYDSSKEIKFDKINGTLIKAKYGRYKISLQAALWEKETLLLLIKNGEDPWEFEIEGSKRSQGMKEPFLAVQPYLQPMHYINGSGEGWIRPGTHSFLKKENIIVNSFNLPVAEDYPITMGLKSLSLSAKYKFMSKFYYKLYKCSIKFLGIFDSKIRQVREY